MDSYYDLGMGFPTTPHLASQLVATIYSLVGL